MSLERDQKDHRLEYIKPIIEKIEKETSPIFDCLQEIRTKIYSNYTDKELANINS